MRIKNNRLTIYPDNWIDYEQFAANFKKKEVVEYPNQVKINQSNPKITIHVVTYNQKDFIRDTLDGIIEQEIEVSYEIIIGDDDSTDGTREICIEYAKKYPEKIKLFLHKRENNIKILGKPCLIFQYLYNSFHARGKYIAICSGDDYWTDPLKIQKQYDFLETNPDVNITFSAHVIRDMEMPDEEWNSYFSDRKNWLSRATSTRMFTNVYKKIPVEHTQVIAEDTFLVHYLAAFGDMKITPDIGPTVIRRHGSNTHEFGDYKYRMVQSINTLGACLDALTIFKNNRGYANALADLLFKRAFRMRELYGLSNFTLISLLFSEALKRGLVIPLGTTMFQRILKRNR